MHSVTYCTKYSNINLKYSRSIFQKKILRLLNLTGRNALFIGTKDGTCPFCKETKRLFLFEDGISLCRDCLTSFVKEVKDPTSVTTKKESSSNLITKSMRSQNNLFTYLWRNMRECLGLSEYQAKVYIALIIIGQSKARNISRISGVPRVKVYETLKNLVDRGLVKELPTNPLKFVAFPPTKSFRDHLQPLEEKIENLRKLLHILDFYHQKSSSTETIEQTEVWILQGSEVLKKLKSILYGAEKSVITLASTLGIIFLYRDFGKILDNIAEKGVKIQILTPRDSYAHYVVEEFAHQFEVKYTDFKLPVLYIYADWKDALLIKHERENFNMEIGIFFNSPKLSSLMFQMLSENIDSDRAIQVAKVSGESIL
ncbi:hypothetical protein CW705_05450 [Candidatus Bathyarchaeota archaeon]|nr:MAG: hypothetical protein CW705_05450 [Candidatus Bathyarchaeota archaeon]